MDTKREKNKKEEKKIIQTSKIEIKPKVVIKEVPKARFEDNMIYTFDELFKDVGIVNDIIKKNHINGVKNLGDAYANARGDRCVYSNFVKIYNKKRGIK